LPSCLSRPSYLPLPFPLSCLSSPSCPPCPSCPSRPSMIDWMRLAMKAVGFVILLVAIAAGAVYHYARRSLPVMNGTIEVTGISGEVEIVRDTDAIPHIFASTARDGLFGLGYVHAQDRLWQMEFQRRIGFGRLSEVFGAATVPQDRFL